jgi:hypothetical protein
MSIPSSLPSSPTQATETQPVNQNPGARYPGYPISGTLPPDTPDIPRGRKARNRLIRLSSMPSWMYRKVIDMFMLGASPKSVARFIFDYPTNERGGIGDLSFETLRQYLQVLAEDVAEQKRLQPPPTMAQVQAEVRAVIPAKLQQVVAPVERRMKYMPVTEFIKERLTVFHRKRYLMAATQTLWETLERFRKVEEALGDRDLPTQPFAHARAEITGKLIECCAELRQQELSDVVRRKHEQNLGDMGGDLEDHGDALNAEIKRAMGEGQPTPPQPEAEKTQNPVADLSEVDRQIGRSLLEKLVAEERLDQQIRELESQSATGEPAAS